MLLCRMTQIETVGSRAGVVSLACGLIVLAPAFTGARFEYVAPIGFSLIVLSCASQAKLPAMIFGNSVTVFLGEISFSIYLVHWWLLELAQRVARLAAPNDANMLAACFSATVLLIVPLSFLSWRFIELPAQAFGKAYLRPMQDKRAAKPSNENAQGSPLATAL
jgi:peptidoglycan/LPS O-acetylase OafA/YrhL